MNKKLRVVGIIFIVILLAIGAYGYSLLQPKQNSPSSASSSGTGVVVNLTLENFAAYLQQQQVVKDLPGNAVIQLRLYNTSSQKFYVIKRASVSEGEDSNPDMIISIDLKYMKDFSRDMCSTIKSAESNGEMATEMKLSKTSLLWKYKSMLKYRSCFGF